MESAGADWAERAVHVRHRVRFNADVELLAVALEARGDASRDPEARAAVDQPPGFWDELDEAGGFVVPPLVPAGLEVTLRLERQWHPAAPSRDDVEMRVWVRTRVDGEPRTIATVLPP